MEFLEHTFYGNTVLGWLVALAVFLQVGIWAGTVVTLIISHYVRLEFDSGTAQASASARSRKSG